MTAQNPPYLTRVLRYGIHAIEVAARLIAAGEPVAVPTETVYGIAADATASAAVQRIYAAKGRPRFNPLIVHVTDRVAAERIAFFDARARALGAAFWPGPLTLVLPLKPDAGIAPEVTAGLSTIALRVPRHRAMQALLKAVARPLAAPSANASNRISPTRAAHVVASLGGRIALVIDDGPTRAGLESTIVRGERILRPGPVTADEIERCLSAAGPLDNSDPVASGEAPSAEMGKITAPGQLAMHYAPSKALRLDAASAAPDEWLIGFGAIDGDANLSVSGDLAEAARNLFDALHVGDASSRARIAVAPVPREGLGMAINDRLKRAAHH